MFAGRPIIGIAGGIGAGKSTVARLFEQLGCCLIASDEMVGAAYTHPAVKRAVAERFGQEVLDPAGRVDRKRIADIVFQDADQRAWLEKLLHPVANQARMQVMEQAAKDPATVAYVWDSPLLYEARLDELCDSVVFVDAPESDRVARVAERGWDVAELNRREAVQLPLEQKRSRSGFVIENSTASPATLEDAKGVLEAVLDEVGARGGCGPGGCGHCGDAGCGAQRGSGAAAAGNQKA